MDIRVLVADRDDKCCQLISESLSRFNMQVTVATEGMSVTELVRSQSEQGVPFDVVLLDTDCGDLDACVTSRNLRFSGFDRSILIMTSHWMSNERQKWIDSGCDDYIAKPVEPKKLLAMVQQYSMYVAH